MQELSPRRAWVVRCVRCVGVGLSLRIRIERRLEHKEWERVVRPFQFDEEGVGNNDGNGRGRDTDFSDFSVAFDAELCACYCYRHFQCILAETLVICVQAGSTFFDGWDFWDTSDPTHGTVDFVSQTDGVRAPPSFRVPSY